MRVGRDCLHDGSPIEIEGTFCVGDVDTVKPFLDPVKRFDGNSVDMSWRSGKVLVDKDKIEVLEAELRTISNGLQRCTNENLPVFSQDEQLRSHPR